MVERNTKDNKKFELSSECILHEGVMLYRIRALKSFGNVIRGLTGGYVQHESNLSQEGNCWIFDDAKAYENAIVMDDAELSDNASISGNVEMRDKSWCYGETTLCGNVIVCGEAWIHGDTYISSDVKISGDEWIEGDYYHKNNNIVIPNYPMCNKIEMAIMSFKQSVSRFLICC